jgi:hypothetical protein
MKSCIILEIGQATTSGRRFAEHTGLEDTERIDDDPLYSISAERIIRLL